MTRENRSSRAELTRYKTLYILSILGLAALLCVNFGVVYTLILTPPENPENMMRLVYLSMVAGFFILAAQALLMLKKVLAILGRDAEELEQLNTRLERLTIFDELTKAYNRSKFETVAVRELGNVRRYGHQLSGIIFDVDDFKQINETHGYSAGDKLLANLAYFVDTKLRNNDFLFRWRGGKFVILAPHTEEDKAAMVAEKLRQLVGHKIFGGKIRFSISLGVAQATTDDTADTFMQRLQTALAGAKNGGKNRVVINRSDDPVT